ncbi:KilA-N domain-containing protein [Salmonella enterica subsp. enterica serovar Stanley str. ATCC 7308]|nr:KilA-N domain-containing protein [Salmonella enterica subsp. enterica serovar Stanley str. ATCC 7308]EYE79484.1 KilA-N domain-containing protein [Salmonella enterica subsp. enterica serovar Heidelberg str. N1514]KJS95664.1 KilA-N domain-containing protein [Salmonella enterica subsp. enterica serovar Heidelberg str. RI-11-013193]
MLLNIVSVTVAPRLTALKKFWSLTAKGCMFGKNITSPANPRETQPHFFESKFPELLKLLDTVH